MPKSKGQNIRLSDEVHKTLFTLKHPGQSFNGLFIEMIEKLGIKGNK